MVCVYVLAQNRRVFENQAFGATSDRDSALRASFRGNNNNNNKNTIVRHVMFAFAV